MWQAKCFRSNYCTKLSTFQNWLQLHFQKRNLIDRIFRLMLLICLSQLFEKFETYFIMIWKY